jgi:nicotinamidase/pyrazinamidase
MAAATNARARYDNRTALLVVDVQNDFADPNGNLYVKEGEAVIPVVNEAVRAAQDAGATIVYTQDWHPPDTPHFIKDGGTWPVHCVRDTWGAELHPDLLVDGERVRKGTGGEDGYSGFTMADPTTGEASSTGLAELLRSRGVERVVVVGLAMDVCVKATALDAVRLGFSPVEVLMAGTRPVELHAGDGERATDEMREAGVTLS